MTSSDVSTGGTRIRVGVRRVDDGSPRVREVVVGAGLGGVVALVLLLVSMIVPGGRQNEVTFRGPGTVRDPLTGVTRPSATAGAESGGDVNGPATPGPLAVAQPSTHSYRVIAVPPGTMVPGAAGAGAIPPPTTVVASASPNLAPAPAASPAPTAASTAAVPSVLTAAQPEVTGGAVSLGSSPQPGSTTSCEDDMDFVRSFLRSMGFASCAT